MDLKMKYGRIFFTAILDKILINILGITENEII